MTKALIHVVKNYFFNVAIGLNVKQIEPTNENLWELKRKSGGSHASKTSDIDDKTLKG